MGARDGRSEEGRRAERLDSKRLVFWLGAILISGSAAALSQPPMSEEELALLKEGVRLHDAGEYEAAIESYRAALELDATNAAAYHQIAFAASAMGDHELCLESAREGLEKGDGTADDQLYSIGGSCADELERLDVAAELFAAGEERFPQSQRLLYNYAVHHLLREDPASALEMAARSIDANPFHASSHYLASFTLAHEKRNEPALLAGLRFLSIEPSGPRALEMLGVIESLFRRLEGPPGGGNASAAPTEGGEDQRALEGSEVEEGEDEGEGKGETDGEPESRELGTLRVEAPQGEEEETRLVDMVRSAIGAAAAFSPDGEPALPGDERRADIVALIAEQPEASSELGADADPLERRYRTFFASMHDAGVADAFSRYALQMVGEEDLQTWVQENQEAVGRLVGFLRSTP